MTPRRPFHWSPPADRRERRGAALIAVVIVIVVAGLFWFIEWSMR